MNKTILILLLFIGIILIVIDITKNTTLCPKERVVYRYIPKPFDEEQNEPVSVSDIFATMFSQPSPWITSVNNIDNRKQEAINKYFISQI